MEQDYRNLFKHIAPVVVPDTCSSGVLLRVERYVKRQERIRFGFFAGLALVSLIGIVPIVSYLMQTFAESGFYQFASLVVSDGAGLASYWQPLAWSLAESLPLVGIAGLLTAVAMFLWFSSKALKNSHLGFLRT